jgi:nicotinamidase-related amidase
MAMMDWTNFLTEQDRALLDKTIWTKPRDFGLGERPALLIVDDYYGALGLPRAPILDVLAEWPSATGEDGWAAIDRTVPLLAAARSAGIPVVFFTASKRNSRSFRGTTINAPTSEERRHEIVAELAPSDDEPVLYKVGPSGFFSTPLNFYLRGWGCDTVLVCGESTSGCVRATVVDAYQHGYRVGLVADCCFDRIQASHWMSLFDMRQKYADLIDAASAIKFIS